jgi:uncharacterized C2H2 Zn-finger protein
MFQVRFCNILGHRLADHVKVIHDKIKDNKCPKCDFAATTAKHLAQHANIAHGKKRNWQKCPHCYSVFGQKPVLIRHIKLVYEKLKDKKCPKCDYATYSADVMYMKAVHDKIKDRNCSQCDYPTSSSSNLTRHIKRQLEKI